MSSDLHTLEPFPLFVDSVASSPNYFSGMSVISLLGPSGVSHLRRRQDSISSKMLNHLRLRYHQYELTFGLYIMSPGEKLAVNSFVLGIFAAIFYAVYFGLQPFIVRTLCQIIYYLSGSLNGVEDLCTGTTCS